MRYNARITTQTADDGIRVSLHPFHMPYELAINWIKVCAKADERNGYIVTTTARGYEATKGLETVRVELEPEHE